MAGLILRARGFQVVSSGVLGPNGLGPRGPKKVISKHLSNPVVAKPKHIIFVNNVDILISKIHNSLVPSLTCLAPEHLSNPVVAKPKHIIFVNNVDILISKIHNSLVPSLTCLAPEQEVRGGGGGTRGKFSIFFFKMHV